MSDNTELPSTSGGDVIRTISNTTSVQDGTTGVITNTEVKTQAFQLLTGPNLDGGASPATVSELNPLYVADSSVRRLLEDILDAIERQTEAIERLG